jgi:hypothetical protein
MVGSTGIATIHRGNQVSLQRRNFAMAVPLAERARGAII